MEAELLENRIIVWNSEKGSELYKDDFYGKPVGIRKPKSADFDRPLELSLFEALYLLQKGILIICDSKSKSKLDAETFKEKASLLHERFIEKYIIYSDLRDKGYVIRPGLKFGADFAVYEHGPGIDHAPFIIHVLPSSEAISVIEMVRAGRLATTVRKKFVIATINRDKSVSYYIFSWFKP
ncbi:MAG: tRNA-intron lyase [Candidatus Lokiarchaeota archaeon]|nr:tRNA-intron lyase [Candidatus Lokiarchaeota archaeon]